MLANQGLGLAHAHLGGSFAEPDGHGARPHFHIGNATHDALTHDADHSHEEHTSHARGDDEHKAALVRSVSPASEHDSNAVYCGESTPFALRIRPERNFVEKDVTSSAILHVVSHSDRLLDLGRRGSQPPSIVGLACPIYLRTLSLRI